MACCTLILCLSVGALARRPGAVVSVVAPPPVTGRSAFYVGSRAPLLPDALLKLPVGAIKPEGWLRGQLVREAEGFSGRLTEISPWCQFAGNAWASPTGVGKNGWEELPYWLRGYIDLGYVTGDARIEAEARKWIDAILASQRKDGYFGPESNRRQPDVWPNMLALYALRSHFEATGDKRVIPFMLRYFRWQANLPLEKFLPDSWQKWRGGDNLDSIYWLYDRTGEAWLLDLARVCHERTSDWVGGIPTWHGVNISQGFREPGTYYVQTRDPRYLHATERDYDTVYERYGQVPGGMFAADENARPGYNGPRNAAETCSMAEMMYSCELLERITGSTTWADRCEDVAFNSLPASMTPDLKGLHYLTAPNMVQLDRKSKAPMLQNGGDMLSYNPADYRCCQHNAAFGWPYFAEHLWAATRDNGLAAALYAPNTVTAKVGSGAEVSIRERTQYPFTPAIDLYVTASRPATFPLYLRIPGWCHGASLAINHGPSISGGARGGLWLKIDRRWANGDVVTLSLPMPVRTNVWAANRNAVSVYRGPLAFSLKIGERWQRYGGTDRFPASEVYATTPWNFGLVVTGAPASPGMVVEQKRLVSDQPFTPDGAPVEIKARARRIPGWTLEANGLVGELQPGPVRSSEPETMVTLIPMGCARLRISAFPQVSDAPGARDWGETSSLIASASHTFASDTIDALHDGIVPKSSADGDIPRFTLWDHKGTEEWVQYQFTRPQRVGWCEVYWFDDEAGGGECRTPASWELQYLDGGTWKPVNSASAYGTRRNGFNRVRFTPVQTSALRLQIKLRPNFSAGILEWRYGG